MSYKIPEENYIEHYGILGMKWGVRRFQPYPKGSGPKGKYTGKDKKREKRYIREDRQSEKILEKTKDKKITKEHRELIDKYKSEGMNDKEAKVAAHQYQKTKRILLTIGAVAVTSALVYGAYKIHDQRIDKIIKSGTFLKNISQESNQGIRDAFYSSNKKMDLNKYKGIFGDTIPKGEAFQKKIKVLSDIKQASNHNAKKIFSDMASKDGEFIKDFSKVLDSHRLGANHYDRINKAKRSIAAGKIDNNVYEVFNAMLVDHQPNMQSLTDKFYKTLSDNGYNAIRDINDSKFSGYKTSNPIITFNSSGKVKVESVRKLAEQEIKKSKNIAYADIIGKEIVKSGSLNAAGVLAIIGGEKISSDVDSKAAIEKYRNEHPGTEKTYTEIKRMLERG